ncbi:MAG: pilus assembly protein PilM [candidate division Zixibacteria bacterium]|nr:pilus assembly protein PilM [candidate division Zixibacteria bacterium]
MSITALFRKKTTQSADVSQERVGTTAPAITETCILPGREQFLGRCLAFFVGTDSLQMAVVQHKGKSRHVLDVHKIYLPSDIKDKEEKQDFISREIEGFIEEYRNRSSRIVVTLSGKETVFRTFHMPILKKSELDSAVRLEAKKQMPFPLSESIIDYRRIRKIEGVARTRYRIALQAATKRVITETLAPFNKLGILVHQVYHAHDVVGQLLKDLPNFDNNSSYTLLNVHRQYSEIAFYKGDSLEFFHITDTGSSLIPKKGSDIQLGYFAETLASEVQTSLDYYSGQYRDLSFSKIYLHGDLAYSDEIAARLKTKLGYEFIRFPVEQLKFMQNKHFSDMNTAAVCLPSLASATCNVRLANLLPVADKATHLRRKQNFYGRLSLAVIIILLIAGWLIVKNNLNTTRNSTLEATRQVEEFRNSNAYHRYNMLKSQIATTRAYLSKVQQSPSYMALNLKELSLLTPDEIRLEQFNYSKEEEGENLILKGKSVSSSIPPEVILAEYLEKLNASPFYSEAVIKRHHKYKTKNGFGIEFSLGMRGKI